MPSRSQSGISTSWVARAMRAREAVERASSVRMLCSRSASLMISTRTSDAGRDDHLADRLDLGGLAVEHLLELGHPVDQQRHLAAEVGVQLRPCV